jgi:uncharacterized protein (DUF58 family)
MAEGSSALRDFDWSKIGDLRLRAESIAEGLYLGNHRSNRKGSGVEFSGHRNYVPGDDLRWLDRHALMRHARLLVREFETETDRVLRLVVDATASMAYKGEASRASKLEYSVLLAAVLARVAIAGGDPVALDWLGGKNCRWLPPLSGRQAFERVLGVLEAARAHGDIHTDSDAIDYALAPVLRYARRGTSIVIFTDLADLPEPLMARVAGLCTHGRRVILVRVLDPTELNFDLRGVVDLHALEGTLTVSTDTAQTRANYLEALRRESAEFAATLAQRGGRFITASTASDPADVVRRIIVGYSGGHLSE